MENQRNLYRIYTEEKAHTRLLVKVLMAKHYIPGYSIIKAEGYWKGAKENSIIIEVLDAAIIDCCMKEIRDEIGRINKQEYVILTVDRKVEEL